MSKQPQPAGTKQLNVTLPSSLHHRFKAKMALKGRTMQEQVIQWIEDEVKDLPANKGSK